MIIGLGTDLIGVSRIARVHQRQGQRFLDRVYTAQEQRYCLSARDPAERLAGRWAAKEACMKALGTGWAKGVAFTQISFVADEDRAAPTLRLEGEAKAVATRLGAGRFHCSISHSDGMAIAVVFLEQ